MGYDVNIAKPPEYYANQLAPYLLSAIYKLSEHKTSKKVPKITAFAICSANGHKGDAKELERYEGFRGSMIYWLDVEMAIEVLLQHGFVARHPNPAYVTITAEGIAACEVREGAWFHEKYRPDDVDPNEAVLK